MWRSIVFSILTVIVYYFIIKGFGEIFSYVIVSNEVFLDINEDYFYLVDTFIYSILILLIIVLIRKRANDTYDLKNSFSTKTTLIIIFLGLLFRLFEDPFLRMDIILGQTDFPVSEDLQISGIFGKIITFLNVILLVPFFEELVYRKFILSFFKGQNIFFGIIFSSVLFALVHVKSLDYINYTSIILAFIFGIIACMIFLRQGLLYCIIFHMTYNLIWFILKDNKNEYWNMIKELNFGLTYWLIFSASLLGIILFLYNNLKQVKTSR